MIVLALVGRLLALFLIIVVGFNAFTFFVAFAFTRGARPAGLAVAFLKELGATLVLIPAWPLFAFLGESYEIAHEGVDPDPTDRRPPVILLHGFAMNRTNWLWFGPTLAKRGIGPLFGLSYFTLASAERSARRLARFVEEIRERTGAEEVDIVAHSLGGLVARHYIEELGGDARVRRLVTIATPHRGTGWARLLPGPLRADLRAGRPPSDASPPHRAIYTSIWSRCDNLILPPESSRLTDDVAGAHLADLDAELGIEPTPAAAVEDVIFEDLGHLSLLVSPRVAEAVAQRLSA